MCVNLGFCDADNSFFELKLETVDEFTKAVLRAEGLELDESSDLYKQVREVVGEAFQKSSDIVEANLLQDVFFR